MRPFKHKPVDFEGVRYYKKPNGYYKCDHALGGVYLHRVVWAFHNGPIPEGFHIHHKDHNKENNDIGNLEIIAAGEHSTYHGNHRAEADPEAAVAHMAAIRPKASEWHKSDAGRQWHSDHGKRTWIGQETVQLECSHCGGKYDGHENRRRRGFCSAKCQSAARRASGVDNEPRDCNHCGNTFITNKYSKARHCSSSCGHRAFRERTGNDSL